MFASRAGFFSPSAFSWLRQIGKAAIAGLLIAGALTALDAEAKRVGGGRSVGRQSQTIQRQQPAQQPAQAQRAPQQGQAAAASPGSRWLGPLAGLAAGLGIAALLSHLGLGEAFAGAMANIIVIALIAFVAIWLIRKFLSYRRRQNAPAYGSATSMNAGGGFGPGSGLDLDSNGGRAAPGFGGYSSAAPQSQPLAAEPEAAPSLPAGFDADAFVRNAKVHFVRLQAAWDAGNMDDIREFTTPEMFAELKLDMDARGAQGNQTDVVQLNAEVLGVEDRGNEYFASVRFSGLIRESAGAAAEPFTEVWNLSKPTRTGEGWLLAGIQQVDNLH